MAFNFAYSERAQKSTWTCGTGVAGDSWREFHGEDAPDEALARPVADPGDPCACSGLWAIIMFYRLGGNIDVILRENFTSILAAEGMKEAIERMDSGLLFAVGGPRPARPRSIRGESSAVSRASESRASEHHAPR